MENKVVWRSLFAAVVLLLSATASSAVASDQLELLWVRQAGKGIPSYQSYHGIATGGGGVYVSAQGPYGAVWLEKRSSAGDLLWRRTPGTREYDDTNGLAVDSSGNVVISGSTYGSLGGLNMGSGDAWFARYSKSGVSNLKKQFGTERNDGSVDVSIDNHDNIYLLGYSLRETDSRKRYVDQ